MMKKQILILVEGLTDLIFVSTYLEKMCGAIKNIGKNNFSLNNEQVSNFLKNDHYLFDIIAVGGCSCFSTEHVPFIKNYLDYQSSDFEIIVITDADDRCEEDVVSSIQIERVSFVNGSYVDNNYRTSSGLVISCKSFLRIIPIDRPGALETVAMESARSEEPAIVNEAENIINNLNIHAVKFFTKSRHFLKGKFGQTFLLLNPEAPGSSLKRVVCSLDMSEPTIARNFDFLQKYI